MVNTDQKMGLNFLGGGALLPLLTLVIGPRTEAWSDSDCSSSSKSNDLKTSALLYAHRCYLKVKRKFYFEIRTKLLHHLHLSAILLLNHKNNLCTFDFLRKLIFALLYMWAISESIIYSFQDIPIAIPAPLNTIPDQILPSHIVVPRCSGK